MRIMHMSRAAETLRWFLIPTMKAQQSLGHYVCVCTSEEPDKCIERNYFTDAQYLRKQGFDVFTHGLKRNLNPIVIIMTIFKIRNILKKNSIDVIICHSPLGAAVGRVAAILAGTPKIIYFAHGLPCAPHQSKLSWTTKYLIEKILGRFTDAMIVMNNYDENLCKTKKIIKNSDKVLRIPGIGVDLNKYNPQGDIENKRIVCNELHLDTNALIVIFVGRLIEEKGSRVFVESAIEVSKKWPNVNFIIAGQGPLYDDLKEKIKNVGMEDRIQLLGWVENVSKYLKAADIFVLPTYYNEGLPVSVLEAMSCGKACIVTQHRGCEDAVEDGISGLYVSVKSVNAVVDKLNYLLDNNDVRLRIGINARRRIESVFALDKCTDIIVKKLEEAMG